MKHAAALALLGALATPALANDYEPAMQAYLADEIADWANDPAIVDAILAQNAVTSGYDAGRIAELDQQWRAEVGGASTPLITPVLENPAAEFLRSRVAASGGEITEIFIMDAVGLNAAASDTTSDYWQGDEEKFSMTYPLGAGAAHFSDVEMDESSQSYQAQISLTIVDPATGTPIGAMTVGVDADALVD